MSTGGLSLFDYGFLSDLLAGGGADGADAVAMHPYRSGGAESVSDDVLLMRSIVAAGLPTNPPIWQTEWGYTSTVYSDSDAGGDGADALSAHAKFVARELLSNWAVGFPIAGYYELLDEGSDPSNPGDNYGLVRSDYSEKPALVAVRALSRGRKAPQSYGV